MNHLQPGFCAISTSTKHSKAWVWKVLAVRKDHFIKIRWFYCEPNSILSDIELPLKYVNGVDYSWAHNPDKRLTLDQYNCLLHLWVL